MLKIKGKTKLIYMNQNNKWYMHEVAKKAIQDKKKYCK